jgi:hypothetical protein
MRQFREWVLNPDDAELLAAVKPQKKRGKRRKKAVEGDAGSAAGQDPSLPPTFVTHLHDILWPLTQ